MEESEKLRKDAEDIEPVELEEVHESFEDAKLSSTILIYAVYPKSERK
jgi:hypothetical protein